MTTSAFYNVDALEKVAINLFYGWGYNFYRQENQMRADDQVIRSKVGVLLGSARKSVETAGRNYRREFLPPPSREKPRPDAAAMANAQAIERFARDLGALQGQISTQPVPENDRMTQRYRQEGGSPGRPSFCAPCSTRKTAPGWSKTCPRCRRASRPSAKPCAAGSCFSSRPPKPIPKLGWLYLTKSAGGLAQRRRRR